MPIAPRPNSMGLPASSNITSYWSNRRTCEPPSASSALAAANPDTEPDSPVEADSPLVAPRRIQTGQNSLSAVAKNLVPQTGHVRGSRGSDPGFELGSTTGSPDSVFTASALLRRRLKLYRLRSFQFSAFAISNNLLCRHDANVKCDLAIALWCKKNCPLVVIA